MSVKDQSGYVLYKLFFVGVFPFCECICVLASSRKEHCVFVLRYCVSNCAFIMCVFVSSWECVPVVSARKAFPNVSNWVHSLALRSPDCASVFIPIGGVLQQYFDYVNVFHIALYCCLPRPPLFADGL